MINWLARALFRFALGPAEAADFVEPIGDWKLVRFWPPWRRGQFRRRVRTWGPFSYEGHEWQYATGAEILAGRVQPREVRLHIDGTVYDAVCDQYVFRDGRRVDAIDVER